MGSVRVREILEMFKAFAVTSFTIFAALTTPVVRAANCGVTDPELKGFYEGGCRNGLAEGDGFAHGSAEYEGEFHKGLKHRRGVKTWPWPDPYDGEFVNERHQGKGMY